MMNSITADLRYFLPELILIAGIIVVFLVDLLTAKSPARRGIAALITIACLAASLLTVIEGTSSETPLFSSMIVADSFSSYFKAVFLMAAAIVSVLSWTSREVEEMHEGEFFALLLSITLGMSLLASSINLLMIFLSLEFVSAMSYVLTAFKKNDRKSSEAALKYVIYGSLASGIMLFGFSYLYGLTGHLEIGEIGKALSALFADGGGKIEKLTASASLVMVLAGFGYKIAAVPLHMWCPDVYEGAPTPVTALLSVGPKAAGFAVLIRFFSAVFPPESVPWPALIGVMAVATMTLGNLAAIVQDNVKRLLAYSSIAHAGYMMLAVVTFSADGVFAVLFYVVVYMLMNLGAFLIVMAVRDSKGREDIGAYRGLSHTHPLLAVTMTVFLFSLVGLPPLGGFIGKFYIFYALMAKAGFWYYVLALIGVVNSAISLYYYARIVKAMFLSEPEPGEKEAQPISVPYSLTALLLAAPVVLLGIYWAPLQELAKKSILLLK